MALMETPKFRERTMKVMQLRLDDAIYAELERRALLECKSMTAVVTDALSQHLKSHDDVVFLNGSSEITRAAPAKRAAI